MSTTRNSRSGLTLVELLLAIAILGVITGVVAATFHTAVTGWRTATSASDAAHYADAAVEQIYMALRSAYYPESTAPLDKYGFSHTDDGDPPDCRDTFTWVKLGNALIGEEAAYAGVPHRVVLEVLDEDAPQGPGLYVRAWRLDGQPEDFDPAEDVEPILFSSAVVGLDCKMMDPDARPMTYSDPIEWIDDWEQTNRIPEAVRFSLVVAPPTPKDAPLVVERFVGIPMSELSWNPTVTGKRTGTRRDRPQVPGQNPGGNAGGRPGGNPSGRPGGNPAARAGGRR